MRSTASVLAAQLIRPPDVRWDTRQYADTDTNVNTPQDRDTLWYIETMTDAVPTRRLDRRAMKERTIPDMIWAKVMGIAEEMAQEPSADLQAWLVGQVYIAATYALLGAQALGLDCCPMTHFDGAEYSRILELPENVVPVVLLPVGYAADQPRPKWRYPLEEILV